MASSRASTRLCKSKRASAVGWSSVLFDEGAGHVLGAVRGLEVCSAAEMMKPFIRMCHDRAKLSGSRRPAVSARWRTIERMLSRYWMLACGGTQLDQHVGERAAIEVLTLSEPVMEHVEDAAAALRGCCRAAAIAARPGQRSTAFATLQHRQQIVFGPKVPEHGGLGRPGLADDLVDAHRADPAPGEQRIGRAHNSFVGRHGRPAPSPRATTTDEVP
jgi:hypothetical protein